MSNAMTRSASGLSTQIGEDWRKRSACRDVDPELFHPVGNKGPARLQTVQAKAVCGGCDVVADCLAWAVQTAVTDGIIGGTTPAERKPLIAAAHVKPPVVVEEPKVRLCQAQLHPMEGHNLIKGRDEQIRCRGCHSLSSEAWRKRRRENERIRREAEHMEARAAAEMARAR